MNIAVTGGAGFIGFHVAKKLLKLGHNVVIFDNFNTYYDVNLKNDRIKELKKYYSSLPNAKNKLYIHKVDISDYQKLNRIFKKYKFNKILHLAAQAGVRYSLKKPFQYESSNNLGTLNILELMRKYKIKDLVFASSSSVYGNNKKIPFSEKDNVDNPISLYAATKKNNELCAYTYHHLYNLNCTGLRFFTVYGPWGRPDMAYFNFSKKIANNETINVYNYGKGLKRDFTYIADIVDGIISALNNPFPYEIINLGNNNPIELIKFINIIEKIFNKTAKKKLLPMQSGDVLITYANISKAKKILNYAPKIKIEKGLEEFIIWFKNYYGYK